MEKKNYFEPKEEVIFLQMNAAILVGSGEEDEEQFPGDGPGEIPGEGGTGGLG